MPFRLISIVKKQSANFMQGNCLFVQPIRSMIELYFHAQKA